MSTAEVRRRYKRELAAAKQKLDLEPPVLPPALDDQRCDRCGIGTGFLWEMADGTIRYRRCRKCEEAAT